MHGEQVRRIRRHVIENYALPALQRGESQFEVTASEVHRALGLKNAFPSVCQGLDSSAFLWDNKLALVSRMGPQRSSSVRWIFRFQGQQTTAGTTTLAFAPMRPASTSLNSAEATKKPPLSAQEAGAPPFAASAVDPDLLQASEWAIGSHGSIPQTPERQPAFSHVSTARNHLLRTLVAGFIDLLKSDTIHIYNEFSFQHELGIYLRERLPDHRVMFERNVSHFFTDKRLFTKREIDLCVIEPHTGTLVMAIELKYPRNGQHPEQMFQFCKDVAFVEELKRGGFQETALVILTDDRLFREGPGSGIYGYFRSGKKLTGVVHDPIGKQGRQLNLSGSYDVAWQSIDSARSYALIATAD